MRRSLRIERARHSTAPVRPQSPAIQHARPRGQSNQAMLRRLAPHVGEPVVGTAPNSVRATLKAGGTSLDATTRATMEESLGGNFSKVRIHDDVAAAASAREVGARAYALGHHVVFGAGQFRPSDPVGQRLLAHELRHVMQEDARAPDLDAPIAIGAPDSLAERDAESSAHRFASRSRRPIVRRQEATTEPSVAVDEGKLRAEAARKLVRDLEAKKVVYGHELQGDVRKPSWWWGETEFDCSKFVLWVLAGRQVGDAPAPADQRLDKAIRNINAPPFGRVSDASAVSAMIKLVDQLVAEGKAGPIDKDRRPDVGDLMFWGGHVAIVVDVQPAGDDDVWVVYANMGTSGAAITGVDAKGHLWLKGSEVATRRNLGVGTFRGYWKP